MTARAIVANGLAWRFAPDDPPTFATRSQSILRARVIDELTGLAPQAPLHARTGIRGAQAKATPAGLVGVVGRPRTLFPDVGIALAEAELSIDAPGFLNLALRAAMGPQPGYPNAFSGPNLGDVSLHRAPATIKGRVESRTLGPLNNATITIDGVWPRFDAIAGPMQPTNTLCLWSGLYADRPVGATVRRRNLALAVQLQSLLRPAVAGADRLRLSDRIGLAVGQILTIEPGDPERVEHISIVAIDGASTADQAATIALAHPLRREHAEGVTVGRAVPAAGGVVNAVTRPARAGDVSLYSAALAGIGAGTTAVELSGGGPAAEFHAVDRYVTTSSPDGDYRLAPLHRVAHARVQAAHPTQAVPMSRTITLEWGRSEIVTDFMFP